MAASSLTRHDLRDRQAADRLLVQVSRSRPSRRR